MHGWTGSILQIDLTSQTFTIIENDEHSRRLFLGGRGRNSHLLYRLVPPQADPFGPENAVIFGTGPLAGTLAPGCARCTVTAKSPLTGILGDANFGGFFAPVMKRAGYDHIVITGCAEKPIYLLVKADGVKFCDAVHLWGKSTGDTEAALKQAHGDAVQAAVIGRAGENRVRIACVVHHYNVAGRTGMGAVMGSKNLKAVCVMGSAKMTVADEALFKEVRQRWNDRIKANPFTNFFGQYGSAGPLEREAESGILAVKNYTQTGNYPESVQVSATAIKKYLTSSHACFACPVHCIQGYEVKNGRYGAMRGTKMTEGCNSSCGPSCGNTSPESLFKINNLCNGYGIDVLDFGLLMATAMDWYEHGIIGPADTGGIALNWGNHEAMVAMLEKISRREGFGDLLAEGAVLAAQKIGGDAAGFVSSSKGMLFGGVDPRVLRGSGLCYATGTRGGDHLRGGVLFELPSKEGKTAISPQEACERFGTAEVLDPMSYNKAAAAVFCQDMYTIADCLEVCKFITEHVGHGITLQDMADMLRAVTGMEVDTVELRTVANRVFALERSFLAREGITRKDDVLLGKWSRGPVQGGRYDGAELDPEKWQEMLSDYYRLRGWDIETGNPTRQTLENLGLEDLVR
jgi:aldehyde:ferredoxin oxidoreductase